MVRCGARPTRSCNRSIATARICSACALDSRPRPHDRTGSLTWKGYTLRTLPVMGTTVTTPRLVADALSFAALLLTMTAGRSNAASEPIGFARSTIQISPLRGTSDFTVPSRRSRFAPRVVLFTPLRPRRRVVVGKLRRTQEPQRSLNCARSRLDAVRPRVGVQEADFLGGETDAEFHEPWGSNGRCYQSNTVIQGRQVFCVFRFLQGGECRDGACTLGSRPRHKLFVLHGSGATSHMPQRMDAETPPRYLVLIF